MRAVLSIRTFIAVLVVGSVLPLLVFSGLLVHRSADDEQELIARTVRDVAQGAAGDINRQISGLQLLALALADPRLLQTGDLAAFHTHASELVRRQNLTAVLYDLAGQQLVNTTVPFGAALPAEPQAISRVLETGQADISDLVTDPQTGTPVIRITVPVLRDGHLANVLGVQISSAIAAIVAEQLVQPEQTVGLVDRSGSIVYRTRDPNQSIGLRAPPDFLAETQGRDEGTFLSHTRTGVPTYVAFSRVKLAGWMVGVSIPRHILFAPATHSLFLLLALGAATLLFAGFIAWAIGRAITGPVSGLSRFAAALAAGEQQALPPGSRIREVDAVATAMLAETETLRQQAEQQLRAATALQAEVESRQRVERQLVQAQKMEAVGQLTGGLAHDFNNLLAIAIGNLDMLRELRTDDPQGDELARGALEAVLRGAELTRQLLAFARRQSLAPERCDINQVISIIVELLRRTLRRGHRDRSPFVIRSVACTDRPRAVRGGHHQSCDQCPRCHAAR
jgi:signal transduction histidine kinase